MVSILRDHRSVVQENSCTLANFLGFRVSQESKSVFPYAKRTPYQNGHGDHSISVVF